MSGEAGQLVKMADDIARFFAADPDQSAAIEGSVGHIQKFWDPRMRRKLVAHWQRHPNDLSPLAAAAAERLAHSTTAA